MNWNPFRSYSRSGRGTSQRRTAPRRVTHVEEQRRCRVEQLEERMLLVVGATAIPAAVPVGAGFDGVVKLLLPSGNLCTGSLLAGGRHILTAAHCVDDNGDRRADLGTYTTTFKLASRDIAIVSVESATAHPVAIPSGWSGNALNGSDIAVIELPVLAPFVSERYQLYRNNNEIGKNYTTVGYGLTGTGPTGQVDRTAGQKRSGMNTFSADASASNTYIASPNGALALVADFDDGTAANNTLGDSLGLDPGESATGSGDSGAPAYFGTAIAGINSRTPPDGDGMQNNFGDVDVFTRVSSFAGFVDDRLSGTYTLELDMTSQVTGNDTAADTITLQVSGENLQIALNGAVQFSDTLGRITSIRVAGSSDDDTLVVDFSNGNPIPAGGVVYTGGAGMDRIRASADANVTLTNANLVVAGSGTILLTSIEQAGLTGGPGANVLNASAFWGPVTLDGTAGNDTLVGTNGNDTLIGGSGDDRLEGMDGNDSLQGDDGYDVLIGGVGNDTMAGGLLNDRYVFEPASQLAVDEVDTVLELDGQGLDRLDFRALGIDEPIVVDLANPELLVQHGRRIVRTDVGMSSYLENVTGGSGNDRIVGNENANNVRGQGGDDTLIGLAGRDTLEGEAGDDVLDGGNNFDTLLGGEGNDTLVGGIGDDLLEGMAGDDSLQGEDGYDVLIGGVGNDTMAGGLLSDRYVFEPASQLADDEVDTVLEFDGQGFDRLDFSPIGIDEPVVVDLANPELLAQHGRRIVRTDVGLSTYLENVTGGGGNDRIAGNENGNNFRGQGGSDTLIGLVGQDTLEGEEGNDILDGGDNFDTLWGGDGDDTIDGGSGNDQLRGDSGNDSLYGGTGSDYLAGNDGNDYLDGGRDGSRDTLNGGAGADTLVDQVVTEIAWFTYYQRVTRWNPITRRYETTLVPVRMSYIRLVSEDSIDDFLSSDGDSVVSVYV